jgi:hypothetical protein
MTGIEPVADTSNLTCLWSGFGLIQTPDLVCTWSQDERPADLHTQILKKNNEKQAIRAVSTQTDLAHFWVN